MAKRGARMNDLEDFYWKFVRTSRDRVIPSWKTMEQFLQAAFKEKLLKRGTVEKQDGKQYSVFHVLYHPKKLDIAKVSGVRKYHLPSKTKAPETWLDEYKQYFNKKSVIIFILPSDWETQEFIDMLQVMIALVLNVKVLVPKERDDAQAAIEEINNCMIETEILPESPEAIAKNVKAFVDDTLKCASEKSPDDDRLLDSDEDETAGQSKKMEVDKADTKPRPTDKQATEKHRDQKLRETSHSHPPKPTYNLRPPTSSTKTANATKPTSEPPQRTRKASNR